MAMEPRNLNAIYQRYNKVWFLLLIGVMRNVDIMMRHEKK